MPAHHGQTYWRDMPIDRCIAPIVSALSAAGIHMRGPCCGYGEADGWIDLQNAGGQMVTIKVTFRWWVRPTVWMLYHRLLPKWVARWLILRGLLINGRRRSHGPS